MTRPGDRSADDALAATVAPSTPPTVPGGPATAAPTSNLASDATLAAPSTQRRARGSTDALATADATASPLGERDAATDGLPVVDPAQYISDREVARGGMGRIMAAHDRLLGRPVALKELLHADPAQAARFRREALITARLQHPAIVPVYQAGRWPSGEPFFAMKLVAGRPLDRVITEARTLEARLALLPSIIAAVDAIAYAHSRRVIHRDLKPANVLVGDFGEIVVIDWGLAKDLDATEDDVITTDDRPAAPRRSRGEPGPSGGDTGGSLTIAGAVMGTPAYMPPEQARGDLVDERADVFALGAMLYHLLAGAPPYAARTATDVIAAAIAGQVVPLEQRTTQAPTDLVAIVARAMAHEPADRYPTAQALAEELRRFQTGKLVAAHSYTIRERVARFVRRHKAPVAIAAIAVVAFAVLATLALRRIVVERDRAEQQRRLAERRRTAAETMIDFQMTDLGQRLGEIGRKDLLAGMGRQIRDYYRDLASAPGAMSNGDRARLAAALHTLGQAEAERGEPTAALAALIEARDLLEAQVARHADADRLRLAAILLDLGRLQHSQGAYDVELDTFRRALTHYDALLAAAPDTRAALLGSAAAHDLIGDVMRNLDRLDPAFAEYQLAMAARQRAAAGPGGAADPAITGDIATSHLKLASAHQARGDSAQALGEYTASETLRARLAAADPENSGRQLDLVRARIQVADIARDLGKLGDAAAGYERALAAVDALLRKDAGNGTWRRERGIILSNWGFALIDVGDAEAAIRRLSLARDNHAELVAKDPSNTSWSIDLSRTHFRLGDAYLWRGTVDAALVEYRAGKAIRERLHARDPKSPLWRRLVAWSESKLAYAQWMAGDLDAALAAGDRALDLRSALHADSPTQALIRNELALAEIQLARIHGAAGRLDEAVVAADRGVAGVAPLVAADAVNTEWNETLVNGLLVRADLRLTRGDAAGALADADRALAATETGGASSPESAVWPALTAEAHWLRYRAVHALGRGAPAASRAGAAAELLAARDALGALAAAGRLAADRRPLWDRVRAATRTR